MPSPCQLPALCLSQMLLPPAGVIILVGNGYRRTACVSSLSKGLGAWGRRIATSIAFQSSAPASDDPPSYAAPSPCSCRSLTSG